MTFRLEFTPEELLVLGDALDDLPFKKAYPIWIKMQAQITSQNVAEANALVNARNAELADAVQKALAAEKKSKRRPKAKSERSPPAPTLSVVGSTSTKTGP